MRRYVARDTAGNVYPVMGSLAARTYYRLARDSINLKVVALLILGYISPFFFFFTLLYLIIQYYTKIEDVFFKNRYVTSKYTTMLRPQSDENVFSVVGYRLYPEEMDEHLVLVADNSEKAKEKLKKKQKKMMSIDYRKFGLSLDKLTRHLIFVGTTGAGKTETLMSFFIDVIKNGGGLTMIDGKSDSGMEFKIYNLCKENKYETQFNAVILNKPHKNTPSNTYAPLLSKPTAMAAKEYLGSFIKGGDGNLDYFIGRSKVMFSSIIQYYKNVQKYYGKNFSLSDLKASMSVLELNNIYFISYGMIADIENLIKEKAKNNLNFKKIISKAELAKTAQFEFIKNCETLYEYINQNPQLEKEVEQYLEIDYNFFSDTFLLFDGINKYISEIAPSWNRFAKIVAIAIYAEVKNENRTYLYNKTNYITMTDIREIYGDLKINPDIDYHIETYLLKEKFTKEDLIKAFNKNGDQHEYIEEINPKAIEQHQYAEQQWSRLFDLFTQYSRIVGTPFPDVDGEDIVKNNKVLYCMLPVLELEQDQIEILGKMFILMIKEVAAIALGGEQQAALPVQFQIYQNKIKPNPIHLAVFDELGAFMTNQLSVLASQARSLRFGLIYSVQDFVSLKPREAFGDEEQQRNLANLAKILLAIRDTDVDKLSPLIPEVEVIEADHFMKSAISSEKIIGGESLNVSKKKLFNLDITTKFAKGCGVYIDSSTEEPIYYQSKYIGDEAKYPLQIRRYLPFN
jgi:hypothetical protein